VVWDEWLRQLGWPGGQGWGSRVYLQLQDAALTAMAVEGQRLTWLERVPLPEGICVQGIPQAPVALGDLLGDWLVERGHGGSCVKAVLPPMVCPWWVADPVTEQVDGNAPVDSDDAFELLMQPITDAPQPCGLRVAVPKAVLDGWLAVFDQAAIGLEALQAAPLCQWNALACLRGREASGSALLQLQEGCNSLLRLAATHPHDEQALPGDLEPETALESMLGAMAQDTPLRRLWVVADGWAADSLSTVVERLQLRLSMAVQALDPVAMGWLQAEDHCFASSGVSAVPWTLWGLAAPEVLGALAAA
jgi:hypothetical protein